MAKLHSLIASFLMIAAFTVLCPTAKGQTLEEIMNQAKGQKTQHAVDEKRKVDVNLRYDKRIGDLLTTVQIQKDSATRNITHLEKWGMTLKLRAEAYHYDNLGGLIITIDSVIMIADSLFQRVDSAEVKNKYPGNNLDSLSEAELKQKFETAEMQQSKVANLAKVFASIKAARTKLAEIEMEMERQIKAFEAMKKQLITAINNVNQEIDSSKFHIADWKEDLTSNKTEFFDLFSMYIEDFDPELVLLDTTKAKLQRDEDNGYLAKEAGYDSITLVKGNNKAVTDLKLSHNMDSVLQQLSDSLAVLGKRQACLTGIKKDLSALNTDLTKQITTLRVDPSVAKKLTLPAPVLAARKELKRLLAVYADLEASPEASSKKGKQKLLDAKNAVWDQLYKTNELEKSQKPPVIPHCELPPNFPPDLRK